MKNKSAKKPGDWTMVIKSSGKHLGCGPINGKICKYSKNTLFHSKCSDYNTNRCKECFYFYLNQEYEDISKGSKRSYFKSIAPVG